MLSKQIEREREKILDKILLRKLVDGKTPTITLNSIKNQRE